MKTNLRVTIHLGLSNMERFPKWYSHLCKLEKYQESWHPVGHPITDSGCYCHKVLEN